MRKSTIWILAIIMSVAFFGLLYLQITSFKTFIKHRSDQFNENVNRSLYQISKNLEIDQTKKYLDKAFIEEQKKRSAISQSPIGTSSFTTYRHKYKVVAPDRLELDIDIEHTTTSRQLQPTKPVFQSPNKSSNNAISRTFFDMQEEQKKRYLYERENLNDVITQILHTASNVPVDQRINFRSLLNEIRTELQQNGIELDFQYEIVDRNDKTIYTQSQLSEELKKEAAIYTQVLFPNDPTDKLTYLKVYFPNIRGYLFNEARFIVPTITFTFVLLITFIFIIYSVFRQKRLSEMKNDFMNNMTHELKTPVSTISLAAQMLKDGSIIKSPDAFKHISGVINDETERLSFQVEKVLQMSLFEKEKASLKLKELDVNDIVVSVANTFKLKVEKFGGDLDIDLQATESELKGDKMHFTNVLFNLLDNAVKYRREDIPLKLMIRTWNANNRIFVSVEDNGIGMRKDYVKKIFDRFYRVSTGNRHDVKGFGLGLAYVKKIVEDHKGTIKAESEINQGTKFIISLALMKEKSIKNKLTKKK